MNTPPSLTSTPSRPPRVMRAVCRPRIVLLALAALVAIIAGSALTASSFTSRAGTTGDKFASASVFGVRNVSAPAISGTTAEGSTLTATPGTWKGAPTSYVYEWQKCKSDGTQCSILSTANGTTAANQTRTLTSTDAGTYVRMSVRATNSVNSVTEVSALVGPITATSVHNINPPTISGSIAGTTLTLDKGTWGGNPTITYAYKWLRCDAAGNNCLTVAGQTGTTLQTTMDDAESVITATVSATNGATQSSQSAQQAIRYPALTAAAGIVGSAEVGLRVTSSTGFNGPVDQASVEYRWQRCTGSDGSGCTDIAGATDPNYTVTTGDIGFYLRYHLKATAKDGSSSVDKDSVMTDSTVKARRVSSIGDAPTALATAPDGRLFVGGGTNMKFAQAYTGPLVSVAADGNGELSQVAKTAFSATDPATTAKVIGDGRGGYIVGATRLRAPDGSIRSLIRVKGDGSVDLGYPDVDGAGRVTTLMRGKDNTIYVGGAFTTLGGAARRNAGAIDATGQVKSWDPSPDRIVYGLAQGPGGRIYITGDFVVLGGQAHQKIGLVMSDGTVVHSFAPPVTNFNATGVPPDDCVGARNVAVADDGTVYFTGFNCTAPVRGYAFALNPDGTKLSGYTVPVMNDNPHTVYVDATTVYVGGFFTVANGVTRNRFAAYDRRTGALKSWAPSFDKPVWAFEKLGNRLYAAGEFTTVDGTPRDYSAAFDTSTPTPTLTGWAPKVDAPVNGMTIEDSSIQMTGKMNWWGVTKRSGLAVLDADGQIKSTATSIDAGTVKSIAVNGTDTYLGGTFTQVGGQPRTGVAKIDAETGAVSADDYRTTVSGSVNSVLYAGNSLWVGGIWGTGSYPYLARFTNGTATMPTAARPGPNRPVQSMTALSGARVAIGGTTAAGGTTTWTNPLDVTTYGTCSMGVSNSSLAVWRLDVVPLGGCANGLDIPTAASVFNTQAPPSPQINGGIYGLAARPDGAWLQAVGDIRDVVNNKVANGVFWNPSAANPGAAWGTIDLNTTAKAVVWSPSANAFVTGGTFATAKGVSRPYLAQHASTYDANAWNPGAKLGAGGVNALGVSGSEIFVGGGFQTFDGIPSGNLITLHDTTGAWIRYET
jgi:hypothetical protein